VPFSPAVGDSYVGKAGMLIRKLKLNPEESHSGPGSRPAEKKKKKYPIRKTKTDTRASIET